MPFRHSRAIARHELRVLRREPLPLVILTAMPLILMALFEPVFEAGARQTVPGMTVLFAFFLVGNVGYVFFREHAWGTWERLRASSAGPAEIMIGKIIVPLAVYAVQFTVLFAAAATLLQFRVRGSLPAFVAVGAALALCLVALGLLLVAWCRSLMMVQTLVNLGSLTLAGAGGALVPLALLPGWIRATAPATPGYWAMKGFSNAAAGSGGCQRVIVALLAWALAMFVLAAVRMRFAETKSGWA
jgi:ABC-2 type transport system permease protein